MCLSPVQHVILAVKRGISMGIPDVPHLVSIEIAKLEYRRRQALKVSTPVCPTLAKGGK